MQRSGGEADLVVDDEMDRAAGAVALEARKTETLRDHALAREGRVAMQQDRQDLGAAGVAHLRLFGARLAEHDRVHRFEMAGVGGEREVDGVAVEFAVRRGAEMVFDVAGALDLVGLEAAALELVEDRAVGLAHDVGEHREAAAMRHADDDLLEAELAAALDDLLHRRDQRLAAVEAEAFGAGVFDLEELLEALGLDELVENGAAAALGEDDLLAVALDALLQPGGLFGVGDVHVLEREGAAIGRAQDLHDLAHRAGLKAQHVVEEDRPVHVAGTEAVAFGREFGMRRVAGQAQRVEIGDQVAADAVGADDHQRAQAVEHGLLDLGVGERDALLGAFGADFFADGPGRIGPPLSVERRGQLVARGGRPVSARPGRAGGVAGDVGGGFAETLEEILPARVDAGRVLGVAGVQMLDVIGVLALEEGRRVELRVLGVFGHSGLMAPSRAGVRGMW